LQEIKVKYACRELRFPVLAAFKSWRGLLGRYIAGQDGRHQRRHDQKIIAKDMRKRSIHMIFH